MQPHRLLFSMAAAASVLSLLAPAILAQPDQPIDQRVALYLGQPTDDNMLTPPPKATLAEERATLPVGPLRQPTPMRALAGTRGVTDGEPATAEAHCCGMKGLGGAKIETMCKPGTVAQGQPFTVNVNFTSDVKRPVDVHVDVLNAQTKQHYAGAFKQFDTQAGLASLTIQMPYGVQEPFLWKVFLTPRGEPFPNMLAETGFVAHLAPTVEGDCEPFESYGFDPPELANNNELVDYVLLSSVPAELTPGSRAVVVAEYNLVGAEQATISASLMRKGPNTMISATADVAAKGQNQVSLSLPVPMDAPREPVYIVVTLTPDGETWENRLAEDRTYSTRMAGTRMLRA